MAKKTAARLKHRRACATWQDEIDQTFPSVARCPACRWPLVATMRASGVSWHCQCTAMEEARALSRAIKAAPVIDDDGAVYAGLDDAA